MTNLAISLSAIAALLPATLLPFRRTPDRDYIFWMLLAVAVAGPALWIWVSFGHGWRTGLAAALWVTVLASLGLFALLSAMMRDAWRLAPLLFPYLIVISVFATVWLQQPERPLQVEAPSAWIVFHIAVSLATYGLLTIGAIAGLAVMLQERALKIKRPNGLTRILPSVSDGERIQVQLLTAGALILGCDLLSGMAAQYFQTSQLIEFSHKIVLSLLTFAMISILLLVHVRTGVRGRRAARYVLAAYLLLTLAYPGVKFVTDVVLA